MRKMIHNRISIPHSFITVPLLVQGEGFITGLIAMEIGLLIGSLIPRSTEGVLIIIAIFGIGMSVQGKAAELFPTYSARQLFRSAMFADDPLVLPFVEQGLLILIALMIVTLISWYFRIRVRGFRVA